MDWNVPIVGVLSGAQTGACPKLGVQSWFSKLDTAILRAALPFFLFFPSSSIVAA